MKFMDLSELSRGMILLVTFITLITTIYNVIRSLIIKRNKFLTFISIVAMLVTFVLFEILELHHVNNWLIKFELPLPVLLALQISLFFLAVVQQFAIGLWANEHISAMSVKEAFDKLPTGLCYYYDEGIPVMVNDSMHEISKELFGKPVTDVNELLQNLGKTEPSKLVQGGEAPIALSESGKAYSINRNTLDINGKKLPEIITTDVSSEYALTKELEIRQAKAKQLNSRLKVLFSTIEYVTMNRELLQLKTALHDNIGQSILIAKRYLHDPQNVDESEMLRFWRRNIRHLLNDEAEEWELPYYVISKEADKLGIKLEIIGELPKESRLIPVVDAAISVHIGNTLKHADGTTATIKVHKTAGSYILNFINDGKKPDNVIIEKGGLKNLRSDVENIGGTMKIFASPEFCMEIILPGEDS